MSLDVSLYIGDEEVFERNITHNLNKMAMAAGIYKHLWRPEELNIEVAKDLIEPLTKGFTELSLNPKHYQTFDAPNGWGVYQNLVDFVRAYVLACKEYPDARIEISR